MIKAFTYMFRDNMFLQKFLTYAIFAFFYFLFTLFIQNFTQNANFEGVIYFSVLLIFISLIMYGYSVKCVKAIFTQEEHYVLPFLNIWSCTKTGLKMFVSYLLACLILIIPFIIPIVNFVLMLFYLYILIALFWIFVQTEGFKSFFRIKAACKIISYAKGHYFLSALMISVTSFLAVIFSFGIAFLLTLILEKGIQTDIITSLIASFTLSYIFFVDAYLIAKAIKPECVDIIQ